MKKLIVIFSVCLVSMQLIAQNKQEKIVELLNLMQSEQMIDKMFDNMVQVMKQQTAKEMNKDQEDELMIFVMSEMKAMTKKAMSDDFPRIYDKYLEEKDIDALIVFYKSPTGQKFLRVSPDIQKEFMQGFMTDYMPEFQKKVEQKKQDIKGD